MFRREFLTRSRLYGWIRNRLPWVRKRRNDIVAVTFNGVDHKLETLLTLPEGTLHHDSKGRSGRWSRVENEGYEMSPGVVRFLVNVYWEVGAVTMRCSGRVVAKKDVGAAWQQVLDICRGVEVTLPAM